MPEKDYMDQVRSVWRKRCNDLDIKPGSKVRAVQLEAYLQGVLAVATATGVMTMDRANQIAFLVSVGRGEEFLKPPVILKTAASEAPR